MGLCFCLLSPMIQCNFYRHYDIDMQSSWISADQLAHLSNDLHDAFLSPLPAFQVVRITGPDNRKFLQGQVTADIAALPADQWLRGAHCDAKGKMWSTFYATAQGEDVLWLAFRDELQASLQQLKKYGVFSKVSFQEELTTAVFGVGGANASRVLTSLGLTVPAVNHQAQQGPTQVLALAPDHFVVITDHATAQQWLTQTALLAAPTRWLAQHIEHGIPYLEHALQAEYVPQQLNLQALNAISFTKGCYMGQEMVARMKYLGKNKRAMYLLHASTDLTPIAGQDIEMSLDTNWRRAGVVVNAVNIHGDLHLLAVLPNDLEPGQALRLAEEPSIVLQVRPLPYSLE